MGEEVEHPESRMRPVFDQRDQSMPAEPAPSQSESPSRRRFLRGGLRGLAFFGLGSAAGWFSSRARARAAELPGRGQGGGSAHKEFEYDVSKFRKTDPAMLRYEPAGSFAAGLKELRGIAVGPNDRIFVAGDQAIRSFTPEGTPLNQISAGALVRCLAIGMDGTIFAGLKNRVLVLASDGTRKADWAELPEGALLTSIAVSSGGVFVADAGRRVIVRYETNGRVASEIGRKDKSRNVPGFIVPSPYFDVAVGADGMLWAANPGQLRMEAYTLDGRFELSWGEPSLNVTGFCGCCNPVHFALLPDGRFVTSEKGIARIKLYSPDGKIDGVVAGPESFPKYFENPNATHTGIDVATDSKSRVLIADTLSGEVRIFMPKK